MATRSLACSCSASSTNGLDYVKVDSFLKILIRGLILLIALIINVYAERCARRGAAGGSDEES
ncbi:MAG: hypothetical protein WA397_21150 [Roseiarcus sp.]